MFRTIILSKIACCKIKIDHILRHQSNQVVTHGPDYRHSLNYSILDFLVSVQMLKISVYERMIK